MHCKLVNTFKLLNNNTSCKIWLVTTRNLSSASQINGSSTENSASPPPVESVSIGAVHNNNQQQRSLHVAVIGVPNAGKSTFINNIINHRVCPTSAKVHTTRKSNTGIWTTGHTQLVFYDTPGLVTQREIRKHNLEQSYKSAYRHAIQHADMIAVLHDASNSWTRKELHPTVIDTLKVYANRPSLLILNKIDALKSKRLLLEMIKTLTNNTLSSKRGDKRVISKSVQLEQEGTPLNQRETTWSHFENVFLVSSLTSNGLQDVQDHFLRVAKNRPWKYAAEMYTDETPEALIVESVRARLLDYLPQEIPYNLKCVLEYYSVEKHVVYTSVQIECPTARIERLICGESNGKLRQITERVTSDLVEMFGQAVSLTISTKASTKKQ